MTLTRINVGDCPAHGPVVQDGDTCQRSIPLDGGGSERCGLAFEAVTAYAPLDSGTQAYIAAALFSWGGGVMPSERMALAAHIVAYLTRTLDDREIMCVTTNRASAALTAPPTAQEVES